MTDKPKVTSINGTLMVSSLDISKITGIEHDQILQAIQSVLSENRNGEFNRSNFKEVDHHDADSEHEYLLSKRALVLLFKDLNLNKFEQCIDLFPTEGDDLDLLLPLVIRLHKLIDLLDVSLFSHSQKLEHHINDYSSIQRTRINPFTGQTETYTDSISYRHCR